MGISGKQAKLSFALLALLYCFLGAAGSASFAYDLAPVQDAMWWRGLREPRREARAVWITRSLLADPETLAGALELATSIGCNMVFLQVNGRGEAYYASQILPEAPEKVPRFDPLRYAVEWGQRHGVRIHAWVNTLTVGSFYYPPRSSQHVVNAHPEWVMQDPAGRSVLESDADQIVSIMPAPMLDPGIPEVR